ncbi:hypothetical protein STEG23_033869, partial [Scotinomys teguina]
VSDHSDEKSNECMYADGFKRRFRGTFPGDQAFNPDLEDPSGDNEPGTSDLAEFPGGCGTTESHSEAKLEKPQCDHVVDHSTFKLSCDPGPCEGQDRLEQLQMPLDTVPFLQQECPPPSS